MLAGRIAGHATICVNQSIMRYNLNLYSDRCQLLLSKMERGGSMITTMDLFSTPELQVNVITRSGIGAQSQFGIR